MGKYIHQKIGWPNFTWNSNDLSPILSELRYRQGLLVGRMKSLDFKLQQEAGLETLTNDVVKSSAIEGERLDLEDVRSSIAKKLGIELKKEVKVKRDIEGIVEVMFDATQNYDQRLTQERLFRWHAALFPTGETEVPKITVGEWRKKEAGPMRVVSGVFGNENVHFEAPDADLLNHEMKLFLNWFENLNETDLLLKAGIAHFWFITIHPFSDGNGRIARAIADMSLARAENSKQRFYSMSTQIEKERRDYYQVLEAQQRGELDITLWLKWFLACLGRSIENSEKLLSQVIYKSEFWKYISLISLNNGKVLNLRQHLIVSRMLDDFKGHMSTSKYAKIAKCSNDTALRDIKELCEKKLLLKNSSGGRSTSYRLASISELKDLP